MICWVRSATRTASSVGNASASSKLLVCSDCVPPSTALMASRVVRTTLFSGCCAVSVTPPVWVWKRSACERSSRAWNLSRTIRAHIRRAARNFATSSKKSMWQAKKNETRGAKSSIARPAASAASTYATAWLSVKAISSAAVAPASRMW